MYEAHYVVTLSRMGCVGSSYETPFQLSAKPHISTQLIVLMTILHAMLA